MGSVIIIPNFFPPDNLGKVTLKNVVPVESIGIVGDATVTGTTATYEASFTPSTTTQRSVTWSVESGGTYATINANTGVLTILQGANNSPVTIKATSTADATIYATKTLSVTYHEESSVQLIYSQVDEVKNAIQEIDFDVIATDNWMILFYRDSGTGVTTGSDIFCSNGGFTMTTIGSGTITKLDSTQTSSSSTRAEVFKVMYVAKVYAFKKENGVYYYTIDGTNWTAFNSFYYSGKSSSKLNLVAGCTTYFANDVYGFYLYDGVDDSLVSNFFNQHL